MIPIQKRSVIVDVNEKFYLLSIVGTYTRAWASGIEYLDIRSTTRPQENAKFWQSNLQCYFCLSLIPFFFPPQGGGTQMHGGTVLPGRPFVPALPDGSGDIAGRTGQRATGAQA